MTEPIVHVQMARIEGAQLAKLVDDLRDLVGADRDLADPAIARLAPDPYPDDREASLAFREATGTDLLDRRALDADIVRATIADLRGDLDTLSEDEAFASHDLAVTLPEVDSWIRTLTALRLVIAARLGIDSDDDHDPDDARYRIYDWLGYRLEVIVQAADELL